MHIFDIYQFDLSPSINLDALNDYCWSASTLQLPGRYFGICVPGTGVHCLGTHIDFPSFFQSLSMTLRSDPSGTSPRSEDRNHPRRHRIHRPPGDVFQRIICTSRSFSSPKESSVTFPNSSGRRSRAASYTGSPAVGTVSHQDDRRP